MSELPSTRLGVAIVLFALAQTACQSLTLRMGDSGAVTIAKVLVRSVQALSTLGMAEAMYGATDCLTGNLRWWGKDKVRKWRGVRVKRMTRKLGPPTRVLDLPSGHRSFYWSLPSVLAQRNFPYWAARSDGNRPVPALAPGRRLTPEIRLTVDDGDRIVEWSGNCVLIP